jgi:hypothetical protein
MYSISCKTYGSISGRLLCFDGKGHDSLAWLTVANIWRNVLAKNFAVVPQDFPHKNVNIFIC